MFPFLRIFIIFLACNFTIVSALPTKTTSSSQWNQEYTLDEEKGVQVRWKSTEDIKSGRKWLTMEIFAPTQGYVAVGFSPHGGMDGSDIVVGWVAQNRPYLRDFHGVGNVQPVEDTRQNYDLLSASENENGTTIRFQRLWKTCDDNDRSLTDGTTRLIWAFGSDDPELNDEGRVSFDWHGAENRGVKSVTLTNRPVTHFPDGNDQNIKIWDLRMNNYTVEPIDTSYSCTVVKYPEADSETKHHYIGYQPIIPQEHRKIVHHIAVYECELGDDPALWKDFESGVGVADHCLKLQRYLTKCASVFTVSSIGSEGELLPKHIGHPIGHKHGGSTFFFLQIHYDNPMKKSFTDSSGLRFFYTDKLREHDSGYLLVGHRASSFEFIPPLQQRFTNYGICPSACTEKMFPPGGIKVTDVLQHGHATVRQMRLRHIRNGKEMSMILEDNHYDFNYQQSLPLKDELTILPGDDLISECVGDTTKRNRVTLGGGQSFKEMCIHFLLYYPKTALKTCLSQPEMYTFYNTFGVQNVSLPLLEVAGYPYTPDTWEKERNGISGIFDTGILLELMGQDNELTSGDSFHDSINITEPQSMAGMSVGEYWREKLNWKDPKLIGDVQESLKAGPHYSYCNAERDRRIHLPNNHVVPYPKITEPIATEEDKDCPART